MPQEDLGEEAPAPMTPTHTVTDDCPGLGEYVVSLRRGFRRLHRIGDCHLVPGVDYADVRALGSNAPSREQYDASCKWCFKPEAGLEAVHSSSESSESS